MNICGYMQPDPFLLDYYDLCSRRDGFLDRFHISCPNSRLLTLEEVEKNVETLNRYMVRNYVALQIFIKLQMLFIAPAEFTIGEFIKIL